MVLPTVVKGDPHVSAHNSERETINELSQAVFEIQGALETSGTGGNAVVSDVDVADLVRDLTSQTYAAILASFVSYPILARNPELLLTGAVTRDANGAATSAAVKWPDGSVGTYTATTLSTAFPGAVDGYKITYGNPVTKTYTQPNVTRNAAGAVTNVPAIVVT